MAGWGQQQKKGVNPFILMYTPIHLHWLNPFVVYFSTIQRTVLTPNDFATLKSVRVRLRPYEE